LVAGIRFDKVGKRYPGGFVALRDFDLTVNDKEFLVLLGPSGCGKSTCLNMMAGLEEVTAGALYFDDVLVNDVPAHRRDVAMVFQSYALYPHKSVFENIAFGLRMRGVERAEVDRRVRDAARRLDIEPLLDRRPSQLSGGQRQRVALGRAMVRQPAVFLMDEPLSNLDAALRISMRAEIKQLHQSMQTTFIYVTHDQAEALTLADRVVVMRGGVVQQLGRPELIYERPANLFVATFLGNPAINTLAGRLEVDDRKVFFRAQDLRLLLDDEHCMVLRGDHGREVTLGLRAEDVAMQAGEREAATIHGRIFSVMPIGSDQFLGVEVAQKQMYFRVDKEGRYRVGDPITLGVNVNRLHVFDAGTEANLLPIDHASGAEGASP